MTIAGTIGGWAVEVFTAIRSALGSRPDDRMGIRSGFSQLDLMTRGFHPSKLYIAAARPGHGKTSFCTSLTANIMLQQKYGVLFITTELNEREVLEQVAEAYVQGVPVYPNGRVSTPDEVAKLEAALFDLELQVRLGYLHIVYKKRLTEEFIEQQIVEHCDGRLSGASSLVIIDQASRIHRDDNARHGYAIATEHMLNHLEDLAERQDVPILLMSQANRATELQKEIELSNIKHSGAFEEFAHCVILLQKGENHGKRVEGTYQTNNEAMIKVAKNRHGRVGKIPAHFFGEAHLWRESAQ
jgi:replicative DNA helicase